MSEIYKNLKVLERDDGTRLRSMQYVNDSENYLDYIVKTDYVNNNFKIMIVNKKSFPITIQGDVEFKVLTP